MPYTDPNISIVNDWNLGENYEDAGNFNLDIIRAFLSTKILTIQNAPPGGPTDGDLHIVGDVGSGAWATHSDKLAYRKTAAWVFVIPPTGLIMFNDATKSYVKYDGAKWVSLNTYQQVDAGLTGALPLDARIPEYISDGATGDITLSIASVPTTGIAIIRYVFVQDGVGSHTLAFPAGTIWDGGVAPTPSPGANARDTYEFRIQTGLVEGFVIAQAQA